MQTRWRLLAENQENLEKVKKRILPSLSFYWVLYCNTTQLLLATKAFPKTVNQLQWLQLEKQKSEKINTNLDNILKKGAREILNGEVPWNFER